MNTCKISSRQTCTGAGKQSCITKNEQFSFIVGQLQETVL